uniref:claudin-4-like n=1 Tax=Monopterus albus TaxID=43700 RepID=UPI0009B333F9|nr:claudin-4-like [Monopterus albus]
MASQGLQVMGVMLAFGGWICTIAACALPMWRVTAFTGGSIITAQDIWEGIWMSCAVSSTGQMQCEDYDSMLALSQDLQAARALMVVSIMAGIMAFLLFVFGGQCTNWVENPTSKIKVGITAGIVFIIAGVLCLIPVCWTAITIIQDFYNPLVYSAQKRDMGTSLYALFVGWAAAALLIIGGGMLCAHCPSNDDNYIARYSAPRFNAVAPAFGKTFV